MYLPASNILPFCMLAVLWSYFDNCIKSPLPDPLVWVLSFSGKPRNVELAPRGHPRGVYQYPRLPIHPHPHFQQHPLSGETCACTPCWKIIHDVLRFR